MEHVRKADCRDWRERDEALVLPLTLTVDNVEEEVTFFDETRASSMRWQRSRVLLSLVALATGVIASSSSSSSSQTPFQVDSASSTHSQFHPESITQTVELASSLSRFQTSYALVSNEPGVAGSIWVVVLEGKEGFVEAWESVRGKGKVPAQVDRFAKEDEKSYYKITLSAPTTETTLVVGWTVPHLSHPLPASVPQTADAIALVFETDLLLPVTFLSHEEKALVKDFRIRIKTPTPKIFSVGEPAAVGEEGESAWTMNWSKGGTVVLFSLKKPLIDLERPQIATVHYQNPEPVAAIRTLHRVLELSHWGNNLAVQDNIDLYNGGPTLYGHFSRLEHQKNLMHRRAASLSINGLRIELPSTTSNPYYYDIVGNVSTSRFHPAPPSLFTRDRSSSKREASSLIELQARYPIFGGWNYTFTIGYDLLLGKYLKKKGVTGGDYVLKVPFLSPIPDVAVDNVTLEIRLPEAARNVRVSLPFAVDDVTFPTEASSFFTLSPGYTKTYLDSTGRPTVVIKKLWCTDRHGLDVIVQYETNVLVDLFQKPFAVAFVLGTVFFFVAVLRRMEWKIGGGNF